jgi:hypothetical protein
MIQMIIKEMEQHTNIIFTLVEFLAESKIWIALCGFGLTIVPILGIMYVHSDKK